MDDPEFTDFETIVEVGGHPIPVRVTPYVLHGLCGANVGPQTAQDIFDTYRPDFHLIFANKLLGGDVEDGIVVITRGL